MLKNYVKLALKILRRRKFFTFISLFGITFTLLVLTVSSAMLDDIFSSKPPDVNGDRTLGIYYLSMKGPETSMNGGPGYGFLDRYVRTLPGTEHVSIFSTQAKVTAYHNGGQSERYLKRTDGEYWKILNFDFLEGRALSASDDENSRFVAVINRATREELFGQTSALGRKLTIDGQTFSVVGVVENVSFNRYSPFSDVWVPIGTTPGSAYRSEFIGEFAALVQAKTRADLPRLRSELQSRVRTIQLPDPKTFNRMDVHLETFLESFSRNQMSVGNPDVLRMILAALTILFMLLPSINLVSINLSRILERSSEIGVRKAFGASSRALVAQFVVENLILTFVGAAIAIILSIAALTVLNQSGFVPYSEFTLNPRVLGYGILMALVFGLMSGVYPAWKMSRLNPVIALRGGSR